VSAAFVKANRARRYRRGATADQRRHIERLANRAGIEPPRVAWSDQATDVINRLEHHLRQPALELGI
jgi:hypothetical protein